MIRLSIGIEDVEDLLADLERGFAAARQAYLQLVGRPQGVYVKFYAGVFDSMPGVGEGFEFAVVGGGDNAAAARV